MSTMTDALRGYLTVEQCEKLGTHATLTAEEVPHPHRPSAEELRAEARRIRDWKPDPEAAHYVCRHGNDLGHPYGADYMCGTCEQFGQSEEADELDGLAAEALS